MNVCAIQNNYYVSESNMLLALHSIGTRRVLTVMYVGNVGV